MTAATDPEPSFDFMDQLTEPSEPTPEAITVAQAGLARLVERMEDAGGGPESAAGAAGRCASIRRPRPDRGSARPCQDPAVRALAQALYLPFRRIQFTPDLLPADLTGTQIYRPATGTFDVRPGPIVTSVLLADEINRAPAKVQARSSRRCKRARSRLATRRLRCPRRSGCWRPRTRSSTRGPTRFRRPSSTAS